MQNIIDVDLVQNSTYVEVGGIPSYILSLDSSGGDISSLEASSTMVTFRR